MIRWCSYCQKFLGEIAPYDDPSLSHGACEPCSLKAGKDDSHYEETQGVRALVKRLVACASYSELVACEGIVAEARALGLAPDSLLVGMIQPLLYHVGREWQAGRMSVAAEHRFTSWSERVFASLPPTQASLPLDLLVLQTPGNSHTLGPRFAAGVLAARGFSTEAIVPDLPFDEIVTQVISLRPRFVGLSCALPSHVPNAVDLITRLRERVEPHLSCRYLLGGFAFRMGGAAVPPHVGNNIEVVIELGSFVG